MKTTAETATASPDVAPDIASGRGGEPALGTILLIFWAAFAVAVAMTAAMNPDMFVKQDPDSLMRLVQVRDLLAGQGWFDLMQYRMDPPDGSLMHWSRVIDAPLAALILLGEHLGLGESFALTAWPLLLFLALMAGTMLSATALAGRAAAVPALILSLVFLDPVLFFLPNSIDHHNAQYALMALMLATVLRLEARPALGVVLGVGLGLMLAIGLEMLPYVGVFGAAVALLWAFKALHRRAAAIFGVSFAAAPALLYLATGPAEAPLACDALSFAVALPAAVAGLGLAGLVLAVDERPGSLARLVALFALAAAALTTLMLVAPECVRGPYGMLSPELKAAFLETVTEAQSIFSYAARRPDAAIATLGPPAAALAIAFLRVWSGTPAERVTWALPLALLVVAVALGFYQVRTLPYANVAAIAVLGAWLAELAARHHMTSLRSKAAIPVIAGFLVACPFTHFGVGWAAVEALSLATGGRTAPPKTPAPPKEQTAGLTGAERECLDPASAALLASVPTGRLLTPVFYGPAALMLSGHNVIAGPYHRAGEAILDAIRATLHPPAEARAVIDARRVDYVALCTTSREAVVSADRAPDGLLAALLNGATFPWLQPVNGEKGAPLRLWRFTGLRGPQP